MSIEQDRLRHMTSAHIRKAAAALTTPRETRKIVWVTVVDGKECPSRQLIYDASELISSLYGRLPDGKVDSVWVGTGCSSISGLFVQGVYLLALMESADPRLIPPEGFTPCC